MNIRQVEIFRAVAATRSVTQAAERLRISQPAVSKYLRLLAEEVGFALHRRQNGRLVLTAEGQALAAQIEKTYLGLEEIHRFAGSLGELKRGRLSVACLPMLSYRTIPELLGAFLRDRPQVDLSFRTCSAAEVVELVAANRVELGIGIRSPGVPGVTSEHLLTVDLVVVLPVDHALARRKAITPRDLDGRDVITLYHSDRTQIAIEHILEQAASRPRRRIETLLSGVALAMVEQRLGVAIIDALTAGAADPRRIAVRPFQPRTGFELCLFSPEHWERSRLSAALAHEIKAHFAGLERPHNRG